VAAIVKLANEYLVPITPRAAGSGVACGAIPVYHGIVMELDRMDKIVEFDEDNMFAVVETGVRTSVSRKKRNVMVYCMLVTPAVLTAAK
jgi:glycolate oxidase